MASQMFLKTLSTLLLLTQLESYQRLQPLIPSSDLFGKWLLFSWLLASFGM